MELINLATNQGVLGIVYDAIEKLQSDQRPDIDSLMEWAGQTVYQESQYKHTWEVACELDKLWSREGINATVLKGRSIAQYYPKPNHRYSCDLDVFIPAGEEWEKACNILKAKGIDLEFEVYKEVEFTYNGVYVECHRFITPVRGNKNLLSFERYLRSLLAAENSTFEGTSLICPPLMFSALLYVQHALGDFLREPLTLKHVVDWMVLRKQNINWTTFNDRCNEFGFERFLQLVNAMADVIEGKKQYDELSSTYKRAYDEIFDKRKTGTHKKSWTERRVSQFFDVLKCGWKYKAFGYMSMSSYLTHTLWTHWFDKDVVV